MSHVLIVGGGAAGMLAGIMAARNGHQVTIFEKNEKLGKKLYITGKGRCNVANANDIDVVLASFIKNQKFMYSSFYGFTNHDMLAFLDEIGLKYKVERGNRVFPASDKSSDVIHAFARELDRLGAEVRLHSEVQEVVVQDGVFKGIKLTGKKGIVEGDNIIIATGGLSYPVTGSTGDGYKFAEKMGHTIQQTSPCVCPMNIKEEYCKELQGLSLRNVELSLKDGKKTLFEGFGEMLFTHFGVTGPLILRASSQMANYKKQTGLSIIIDLKPALTMEQLDARVLRDFESNINKQFKNSLDDMLPKKMIPIIIALSGIDPEKKVNLVTKAERLKLIETIKKFTITVNGLRGYNEAVITRGGVTVKEVNPTTMESKLVKGVYFAGEVLDVDAITGGFNLQVAWSTAYAAAMSLE